MAELRRGLQPPNFHTLPHARSPRAPLMLGSSCFEMFLPKPHLDYLYLHYSPCDLTSLFPCGYSIFLLCVRRVGVALALPGEGTGDMEVWPWRQGLRLGSPRKQNLP